MYKSILLFDFHLFYISLISLEGLEFIKSEKYLFLTK